MRATPLIALVLTLLAAGCQPSGSTSGPRLTRREAVLAPTSKAAGTAAPGPRPGATSPTTPLAADATSPTTPTKPRVLCPGPDLDRPLPRATLQRARAAGASALGRRLTVGRGRWTWISLWAAWCVPCEEETPRLLAWQQRLRSRLRVQFLSLDDDRRQLQRFLDRQPATGMRASFWLPEGKGRDQWLKTLGIEPEPTLPVQILVSPRGQVSCIIKGAVEDSDYSQVAALVGRR